MNVKSDRDKLNDFYKLFSNNNKIEQKEAIDVSCLEILFFDFNIYNFSVFPDGGFN